MTTADTSTRIRSFNRFYTRFVGALDKSHLGSGLSLPEARVVYELANQPGLLASQIVERLGVDPGYLSRMLKRLDGQGLIIKEQSEQDGRASALSLTDAGRNLFQELDRKAAERVGEEIRALGEVERERLTAALGTVTHLLGKAPSKPTGVRLRQPEPGDFGWAVERHGVLYAEEYGWGPRFEGLVAELFGGFARSHNPDREHCWIAELDGERAGCVFVVERTPEVAQLRCLLVEPTARGHGIGGALVGACVEFARGAGYRQMMLWTNKGLDSARKIYEATGFRLVEEQPHRDFGPELIGQNWELDL
jgi:DNA-binding MarR family transcriptional regulator/GNAT superfamily N-acetyltransferase